MDDTQLAKLMIRYEELNNDMEEVGRQISEEVLSREETAVVGNVRATYNSGKRSFDWAAYAYLNGLTPSNDHIKSSIDWRKVCEEGSLDMDRAPVLSQAKPSVSIKVKK